jgi:Cation/multidrug efflux pump
MISNFFINRPIFATVIALLLVIAGLFTLRSLPIAQYPDITPPTIQVSATYPGASAETVAQTIGVPIEQQVNGVEGMMYMSSTSSNGQYNLTITFEVGTNIDMANVMVQNRVNLAEPSLPTAVIQQGLTVRKQSTNIVMFLSLKSDNPMYDGLYLSNYANINIVNELARLPGVGSVSVFGGSNYSMRIWLNPESMRIRGLTPSDVVAMIESQNIEVSAGNVGAPPISKGSAFQHTITTHGRLMTTEEFGNIILKTNEDGSYLRLKDVSTIELGSESYSSTSSEKGDQIAAIGIYQLPGSNSLDVAKEIEQKVEELQKYLPEGISFSTLLNTTEFITASIEEVLLTFLETTLLVVLVIFIFLQNFRAVVIPALSIPVSLIATFAVMRLFGFSINLLTLFGLVLAIAIVVDDAIVVVENASRLLDTGKYKRKEAVSKAMEEIQGPVIGVVLVLLAVFVPTAFIGGITGQLYKQFALTIATATFFQRI